MSAVAVKLVAPLIPWVPAVPILASEMLFALAAVREESALAAPILPPMLILPPPAAREKV